MRTHKSWSNRQSMLNASGGSGISRRSTRSRSLQRLRSSRSVDGCKEFRCSKPIAAGRSTCCRRTSRFRRVFRATAEPSNLGFYRFPLPSNVVLPRPTPHRSSGSSPKEASFHRCSITSCRRPIRSSHSSLTPPGASAPAPNWHAQYSFAMDNWSISERRPPSNKQRRSTSGRFCRMWGISIASWTSRVRFRQRTCGTTLSSPIRDCGMPSSR